MKIIYIIICGLICFSAASAQNNPVAARSNPPVTSSQSKENQEVKQDVAAVAETPAVPKGDAVALKETEFNFGKIPQGKPVTHEFFFTNTGSTPVSLQNVQASCGCTTPEWSKEPVAPGATSKITVGYNAANLGEFTKSITITYNDTQSKQLIIKGEVWQTPETPAPENSALSTLKTEQ